MSFASPIWLVGLVPWGGLVIWVLLGRLEKAGVPFLGLWRTDNPNRIKRKRQLEKPPAAVAAMLLAILLGILAAAGPVIPSNTGGTRRVRIIVDRGLTMSATDSQGRRRFVEAAEFARAALARDFANVAVDLSVVPDDQASGGEWTARVRAMNPTAVVDPDAVTLACRQALAESNGLVIVLSDQSLGVSDQRLIQIAPESNPSNVGIESLAVRAGPAAQAMVRVLNQSSLSTAELTVTADFSRFWMRPIDLPARGQTKDYFFDLDAAPSVVEAELKCADDLDLDHAAWMVRRSAWPSVEARSALSPELMRMIDVYGRDRPASAESAKIALIGASAEIPADMPCAIVLDEQVWTRSDRLAENSQIVIAEGPLKSIGIDWSKVLSGARVLAPAGTDWQPIVSAGGVAVVAVRGTAAKQVWVGFDSPGFAKRADFVVFWSEVFAWLGGSGPVYQSDGVGLLAGQWKRIEPDESGNEPGLLAGLYRSSDGSLRAVNAECPKPTSPANEDWRRKLRAAARDQTGRRIDGELLVAAAALILLAAFAASSVKS